MELERRVPCNYCREKHLKCNLDETPCAHCSKLGKDCIRARKRIRFSKNKRLDASLGFSEHQTWVQTRNADRLSFVDATPQSARREVSIPQRRETEVETSGNDTADSSDLSGAYENNSVDTDRGEEINDETVNSISVQEISMQPPNYESSTTYHLRSSQIDDNDNSGHITAPPLDAPSFSPFSPGAQSESAAHLQRVTSIDWRSDGHAFTSPSALTPGALPIRNVAASPLDTALQSRAPSTALRGLPDGFSEDAYLQLQEACLMRHFAESLAPWVSWVLNTVHLPYLV